MLSDVRVCGNEGVRVVCEGEETVREDREGSGGRSAIMLMRLESAVQGARTD